MFVSKVYNIICKVQTINNIYKMCLSISKNKSSHKLWSGGLFPSHPLKNTPDWTM